MKQPRNTPSNRRFTGFIFSFVLHLMVLYGLIRFVVEKREQHHAEIEVNISDVVTKEIAPQPAKEVMTDTTRTELDNLPMDTELPEISESTDFELEDVDQAEEMPSEEIDFDDLREPETARTTTAIPPTYRSRTAVGRRTLVKKFGGTAEGQEALINALRWLKKVQAVDGSWENKPAHTALALLCFLAHGETPQSNEFGETVERALAYLAETVPADGAAAGNSTYVHGIVTYALSEAYGMTRVPYLRGAMENGLRVILDGQQAGGGFDYKYKKGKRWDLSITGWQVQAMKAGFLAGAGIPDIEIALAKAAEFIKSTFKNNKFGYSSPGSGRNMTGVGTLGLQLLGQGKSQEARGGLETIAAKRLLDLQEIIENDEWSDKAAKHLYGWYYDTQAMFHNGGKEWRLWNKAFQELLIRNQMPDGHWEVAKASYGFTDDLAGKVYCTTLCCLQLEVYYRYLPTYKSESAKVSQDTQPNIIDDIDSGLIIK